MSTPYYDSIDCPELQKLITEATDLMASQQAMPDDAALTQLASTVRAAYELGQREYYGEY